jgi:hypothetical protein
MCGRSYSTFSPRISTYLFIIIEEANEKLEIILRESLPFEGLLMRVARVPG